MPATSISRVVELGAVAGTPPTRALPAQPVPAPAPWGALDSSVAPNFVSVQPLLLPAGTILRRVFGYPDSADPYPSWETGSWWTRQPLPATEAAWRGLFAVEVAWNGGQCVVEWTTPQEIHAWAGPASPQAGEYPDGDPAPGYYLPGGGEQIYIPPAALPIGTWIPGPTPWKTPPSSTSAPTPAAKSPPAAPTATAATTPTVTTLAAALTKLSTTLEAMAREAVTKGVDGGPLRFQVRQLERMNQRLAKFSSPKSPAHLEAVLRGLTGLSRHVHTHYAWSTRAVAAGDALRTVVVQAAQLLQDSATAPVAAKTPMIS